MMYGVRGVCHMLTSNEQILYGFSPPLFFYFYKNPIIT